LRIGAEASEFSFQHFKPGKKYCECKMQPGKKPSNIFSFAYIPNEMHALDTIDAHLSLVPLFRPQKQRFLHHFQQAVTREWTPRRQIRVAS